MESFMLILMALFLFIVILSLTLIHQPRTYLSMTTTPHRLQHPYLIKVVASLVKQAPLLLQIPEIYAKTGEPYNIPPWILQHDRITVNRPRDFGPYTKVAGLWSTPNLRPQDWIVIVDDDIVYRSDLVARLQQQARTSAVINFAPQYYRKYLIPTGYSGWICQYSHLQSLQADEKNRPAACQTVDDHWLGWLFHQKKIPIIPIKLEPEEPERWTACCQEINQDLGGAELRYEGRTQQIGRCHRALKK